MFREIIKQDFLASTIILDIIRFKINYLCTKPIAALPTKMNCLHICDCWFFIFYYSPRRCLGAGYVCNCNMCSCSSCKDQYEKRCCSVRVIPLRVCKVIIIHKSQGVTIDYNSYRSRGGVWKGSGVSSRSKISVNNIPV